LAEFALLAPLFFLILIGIVEFAFAFNAQLNTNYASRAGGLVAAEAGNDAAADCMVLGAIESAMGSPADKTQISSISLQRTNPSGSRVFAQTNYERRGSLTCTRTDGSTITVPYTATSSGYPASQRCNVLPPNGCPTLSPARTTVDTIAVQITYAYPWHTPIGSMMALLGPPMSPTGLSFTDRNVFRIEPVL